MTRIGIICPSEIALRRFLPALRKVKNMEFAGVAYASKEEWDGANDKIITSEKQKANQFIEQYGGQIFSSYEAIINSDTIDAIYLPLPPALHYIWAKKTLEAGKHLLVEKPATIKRPDTEDLIKLAHKKSLALHENYMFAFHEQLSAINEIVERGEIGDVRLYRISFGFPRRAVNDFRYNKALGGGALLDAGGYTLKYSKLLLGETTKISTAQSNYINDFNVDIFGSATLINKQGVTVQVSFGMDNAYKCELHVWGSKGTLHTGRVLTAPEGFTPEVTISIGNETEVRNLPEDDAFKKSIEHFQECISDSDTRKNNYGEIQSQAALVDTFMELANSTVD